MTNIVPSTTRYHRIDGWRGYSIPTLAVAGSSDTGTWPDSPCPTPLVKRELRDFCKHLRANGIRCRQRMGGSSNVFCGKRWVVVERAQFAQAAILAVEYMDNMRSETRFIHDADLEQLGYHNAEV